MFKLIQISLKSWGFIYRLPCIAEEKLYVDQETEYTFFQNNPADAGNHLIQCSLFNIHLIFLKNIFSKLCTFLLFL